MAKQSTITSFFGGAAAKQPQTSSEPSEVDSEIDADLPSEDDLSGECSDSHDTDDLQWHKVMILVHVQLAPLNVVLI